MKRFSPIIIITLFTFFSCKKSDQQPTSKSSPANNGLPVSWTTGGPNISGNYVSALAVQGNTVFAAAGYSGIFRSSDTGKSWTSVNNGLPANIFPTFITAKDSDLFINNENSNSLYFSVNHGASWSTLNGAPSGVKSLGVKGNNIFACASGGMYVSGNNGSSWALRNTGLPANPTITAFAATDSSVIIGAFPSGAYASNNTYKSNNNGVNWSIVNTGLDSTIFIYRMTTSGNNIFAATFYYNGGPMGMYYSGNNGFNWSPMHYNPPDNSNTLYAMVTSGSDVVISIGSTIYFSPDNGNTWTQIGGLPGNAAIYALAINNGMLFAGGGTVVYSSPPEPIPTWTAEIWQCPLSSL